MDDSRPSTPLERFVCPLCEMGLSNGEDLQQHMLVHAGEQESFTCDVCSKVCSDAAMFGKHLRLHTGEKPFKCTQCDKSFREKCSLTRHARIHTGEKPFRCDICNKRFSDVGSFGRHKKTHLGDRAKDHKCPFDPCAKSFTDRSSLRRHMKTHTGERPFQCRVCDKSFTESGSFKRHLRVHTGEKRYPCRICGRPFSEQASRVRHERNVCMHGLGQNLENEEDHESDEGHKNEMECKNSEEIPRSLALTVQGAMSSLSSYYLQNSFGVYMNNKSSDLLNNNISSTTEQQNGSGEVDVNANKDRPIKVEPSDDSSWDGLHQDVNSETSGSTNKELVVKIETSDDVSGDSLQQNGGSRTDVGTTEDQPSVTEGSGDASQDSLLKFPESLFTLLKDKGSFDVADYKCRLETMIKKHLSKDAVSPLPESSSLDADEGAGNAHAERGRPVGLLPWREWLPWGQTKHDAALEKIRTVAPRMLDWLSFLEQMKLTGNDAQESREETQMCFECGELISDDEGDENKSTSGSISPVSNGIRLKCKACLALSFVTEGSLRSVTEGSPRSVTEGPPHSVSQSAAQLPPLPSSVLKNGKVSKSASPSGKDDPLLWQFLLHAKQKFQSAPSSDKRRHECKKCGKTFADVSKLKRHIKIHLNIREFVCRCGKQFIDASSLRRHESVHSDVKPHNCAQCGKGFTDSSGLKKHRIRCNRRVKETPKVKEDEGEVMSTAMGKVMSTAMGEVMATAMEEAMVAAVGEVMATAVTKGREEVCKFFRRERGAGEEMASCSSAAHKLMRDGNTMTDTDMALMRTKLSVDGQAQKTAHHTKESPTQMHSDVVKQEMAASGGTHSDTSVSDLHHLSSPYECEKCGMSFETPASICYHSCTSLPDSENAVSCVLCGKSFESEMLVKQHFMSCHSQTEKPLFPDSYSPETVEAANLLGLLRNGGMQAFSSNDGSSQVFSGSLRDPKAMPLVSKSASSSPVSFAEFGTLRSFLASTPRPAVFPGMSHSPFAETYTDKISLENGERTSTGSNLVMDRAMFDEHAVAGTRLAPTSLLLGPSPRSDVDIKWSAKLTPSSHNPLKRNASTQHASDPISQKKSYMNYCEVCDKEFLDVGSLKRHARLHTDQAKSFRCKNCEKDFSDQGSLKRHGLRGCKSVLATGSGEGSAARPSPGGVVGTENGFACTQCREVFPTKEGQMRHEKEHRVAPSLRCKLCRQSLQDVPHLLSHMRLHATQRPYLCDICLKGFADSGSLSKHRARGCYASKNVKLDASKWPCAACGKVFSDRANFNHHEATHKGGMAKVKPYACSDCGKSFAEACSLKRHTRLHTGKNLCRCLHCDRTFLENSGLKKHLERGSCQKDKKKKAAVVRHHQCNQCGKEFTKQYILARHMKTHSGLRPFPCSKCNKAFTESSSLKRHYRQHTGERPYQCKNCSRSYSDAGVLKKHERSCWSLPFDGIGNSASPLRPQDDDDVASPSRPHSPYLFNGSSFARKFANHLRAFASTSESFHSDQHTLKKPSPSLIRGSGRKSLNKKQQGSYNSSSSSISVCLRACKECWRCGRGFPSAELRERHARSAHVGARPFPCRCCWRRFSRLPYLRLHLRQEHHRRK